MNDWIRGFKDKLFAAAKEKGYSDYEIFYSGRSNTSVRIFAGEIQEYKNAADGGLGFRGTIGGRVGYAFTQRIADDVIPFLVENAAGNAGIIESADTETLFPGSPEYPEVLTYEPALDAVSGAELIERGMAMDKAAKEADPRIQSVDYNVVSKSGGFTYIANSHGLDVFGSANYATGFVMVRAAQDDQQKTELAYWAGQEFAGFDAEKVGKTAAEKVLKTLGAKPVPTANYDIIFDNFSASDLLETFWSALDADRVHKGFSLFKDKLNQPVASECVTMRDDALLPGKPGSAAFDAEGVACSNKVVVENGVLKTYLHNTKTAAKDGVKPTGNGSKASYKDSVGISPTNLYIVPSKTTLDELVKQMGGGILITGLNGLHSGANPTSGDFSLLANGFLVENGEITMPVEQITVAGNFFNMLNNVAAVADDLNLSISSIASPSIRVKGITVSGT